MKLKKLPLECIAPFRLREITLHGIGSYYTAARLEIKPLTILCGSNGSGKSTWMKVLSTVKQALEPTEESLKKSSKENFLSRLNRVFQDKHLLSEYLNHSDFFTSIDDDHWNMYQGPKGSFSISYTCTKTTELKTVSSRKQAESLPSILKISKFEKGDVIRFRFTQCVIRQQYPKESFSKPAVRLSINGKFIEICVGQKTEESPAFQYIRTGYESNNEQAPKDTSHRRVKDNITVIDVFSKLAEDILRTCLAGYFNISAIRNIYDEVVDNRNISDTRYVGESGQHTHLLRTFYDSNPFLDPRSKMSYCGIEDLNTAFFSIFESTGELYEIFEFAERESTKSNDSKVPIDEEADTTHKSDKSVRPDIDFYEVAYGKNTEALETKSERETLLERLLANNSEIVQGSWGEWQKLPIFTVPAFCKWLCENHLNAVLKFKDDCAKLPMNALEDPVVKETITLVSKCIENKHGVFIKSTFLLEGHFLKVVVLLKNLFDLVRRELMVSDNFFRWFLNEVDTGLLTNVVDGSSFIIPDWVRFLSSLQDSELTPADRQALNKWAIYLCFKEPDNYVVLRNSMVFDWWTHLLLGIDSPSSTSGFELNPRDFLGKRSNPVGYILINGNESNLRDYGLMWDEKNPYRNLFLAGTEYNESRIYPPGCFSAGFHQVVPILVQMSVMLMNELLAVENPEVHLHPGLQLRFMSFFIENALIGKFSLIETHSDLMIRRVLRAIHEEKLPQSWVNIFFVDSEQVEGEDVWTSKIERLGLNQQGIVSNWPKGFLDDDVLESEALLRAMYGNSRQTEADDE